MAKPSLTILVKSTLHRHPADSWTFTFSFKLRWKLCGLPVIVLQHPAAPLSAPDGTQQSTLIDFLRRWLNPQRRVLQRLMRPLRVVVLQVLPQRPSQAPYTQEGQPTNALGFDRPHPPLGVGIQIRTVGRQGQCFHARPLHELLPTGREFGVPVMNQVLGPDLLQPTNVLHSIIPGRLLHEGLVRLLCHPHHVNPSRSQVNEEQHINGPLAQPTPNVCREEVSRHDLAGVVSQKGLPGRLPHPALGIRRLDAMTLPDRADGPGADDDLELLELSHNAHRAPTGVLLGHLQHQVLGRLSHPGTTLLGHLDAQEALPQLRTPVLDGANSCHHGEVLQPGVDEPLDLRISEPQLLRTHS